MKTRMLLFAVLVGATAFAQTPPLPMNQYAAKFICGKALPSPTLANTVAAPGTYYTAINVHNPQRDRPTTVYKKFAIGLPSETAGKVSQYFSMSLGADMTMQIDCTNIDRHTGTSVGTFLEGFAVIESDKPLDVVAVYTTGAGTPSQVSSIHTERVQPRIMPPCGPLNLDISTGVATWTLVSGPPTAGPYPRPASTSPNPPIPGTSWVGPNSAGTSPVTPSDWIYETCFCLCPGFQNAQLTVTDARNDDTLTLSLNGPQIGPTILWPGATPAQVTAVNGAPKQFNGGRNCIRAAVRDILPSGTGFDLKATVTGVAASCQ